MFSSASSLRRRKIFYFKCHRKLAVVLGKLHINPFYSFDCVCPFNLLNVGKKQVNYNRDRDEFYYS